MSRNLWAKVTGGDVFRVNLPVDSYVSDLKDAIKTKLAVEFQHTDAPKIVIKNRVGQVVPGNVHIVDYSPLEDLAADSYSLGVKSEFPYMIDVPTAGKFPKCRALHHIIVLYHFWVYFTCFLILFKKIFHILAGNMFGVSLMSSSSLVLHHPISFGGTSLLANYDDFSLCFFPILCALALDLQLVSSPKYCRPVSCHRLVDMLLFSNHFLFRLFSFSVLIWQRVRIRHRYHKG